MAAQAGTMARGTGKVSTRQAAFIGVGAMVGAGIFSLLGAAGEVAGAAVWLSFLLAGGIAALQGYSFAKLGARYPSAGGLLEYVEPGLRAGPRRDRHGVADVRRQRHRHRDGRRVVRELRERGRSRTTTRRLGQGLRGRDRRRDDGAQHRRLDAASRACRRLIVFVVIGILAVFRGRDDREHPPVVAGASTYPGVRDIVSSVALTFFAFLGFGVVTFTAKDLAEPVTAAAARDDDRHRARDAWSTWRSRSASSGP